jgi:uncharacterized membrane protein
LRICARCVGTYPVLAAGLVLQLALGVPLVWSGDPFWALLLPLPAVVDWAWGRFDPSRGTNLLRTFTGGLLGLALARTLFIHFQRPFPLWLLAQGALVTAVAVPVILLTYKGRRRG